MWPFRRSQKIEAAAAPAEEQRALDWASLADIFGAIPAASGISVTAETAMRCPPVACAVGLIAEACGNLPVKVYARTEGGKEADPEHPAYPLVHVDANPWTSASAFRTQLTRDALLHGSGYGLVVRSGARIAELHRLEPSSVAVEYDEVTAEPSYRVSQKHGGSRTFSYRDVIHVPAFGGVAPIHSAKEAIALALVLERHCATYFGRGGRPDGLLVTDQKLGAEVAKRVMAAWKAAFGGGKSGGTTLLDSGIKYSPVTFNSVDSQLEQLRRFQILEICRAFRVSPVFLQEYGRATWSNSSEMGRQFLQFTLLPWLRVWEAAYRRTLLADEERASYSIEFLVDDLLRADIATRATAYSQFRAAGILTSNEIRAMENRPPLPGGDSLANPNITPGAGND